MKRDNQRQLLMAAVLALVAPLLLGGVGRLDSVDDRLLAAHNRERAALDIAPLAWDAALAADARSWAERLASTGTFAHADVADQGENLWIGTVGHYTPESMVGLWIEEKRHYRPGTFPANSRTGDFADVGHYTQLMWRSTRRVGCAVAVGRDDEVLVCRYSAAGNMIGERPF